MNQHNWLYAKGVKDWLKNWREHRGSDAVEVVCFGEALIELSQYDPTAQRADLKFAGDTCNTAIYLNRAVEHDPTLRVSFATALGVDPFSNQMLRRFEAEGLGTQRVHRHPTQLPGIYAIEVDEVGERHFSYWRDQSAAREMIAGAPDLIDGADLLYLSGITLAVLSPPQRATLIELLDQISANGGLIAFDSNYRPRLWADPEQAAVAYAPVIQRANFALLSDEDVLPLFGSRAEVPVSDSCETLFRTGSIELNLRQGAKDVALSPLPAAARVVDSTGAGDSFNGAYLAARLTGQSPADAVQTAHALALNVISQPGAIIPRS